MQDLFFKMTAYLKIAIGYWIAYLLVMCFYFYQDKIDDYRNSERVTATVVDKLSGIGRRSDYYYPQFQFTFDDSVYTSAEHLVWVRSKDPGDKIKLIFPRNRPEDAIAYTFISYWVTLPKLIISFLVAYLLFMIPYLYRKLTREKYR